jgi:hypothetical protein
VAVVSTDDDDIGDDENDDSDGRLSYKVLNNEDRKRRNSVVTC